MNDYEALCNDQEQDRSGHNSMMHSNNLQISKNLVHIMRQITPILVAVFFAIFDNLPYTLIFLPAHNISLAPVVASMLLNSVVVSQFTLGSLSNFPSALGACAVEAAPFFSVLASSIATQEHYKGHPERVESTVIAAFMLTSITVAITLELIVHSGLSLFVHFFPKHVLVGVIGGIGIYITTAAIGTASGVAWEWSLLTIYNQLQYLRLIRIGVTVVSEILVLFVGYRWKKSSFAVPTALMFFVFLFIGGLHISTISIQEARNSGWVFDLQTSYLSYTNITILQRLNESFNPFRALRWHLIDIEVLFSQILTILAATLFVILQLAVNIPALALQLPTKISTDHEFRIGGLANFLSGIVGSVPCYMTLSSSSFLRVCGLKDRWASITIAFLVAFLAFLGPISLINQLPRPAAALFILHLGYVLTKEAFVDSFQEMDYIEYSMVAFIAVLMQYDFVLGVFSGLFLTIVLFVMKVAKLHVVHIACSGKHFVPRKFRPANEENLIEKLMDEHVYVIRLEGDLFFGNSQQVLDQAERVLAAHDKISPFFLIVDFSLVRSLDCTGTEKFNGIVRAVHSHDAFLLCCGMSEDILLRAACWENGVLNWKSPIDAVTKAYLPPTLFSTRILLWGKKNVLTQSDDNNRFGASTSTTPNTLMSPELASFSTYKPKPRIRFFTDINSCFEWIESQFLSYRRSCLPSFDVHLSAPIIQGPPSIYNIDHHLVRTEEFSLTHLFEHCIIQENNNSRDAVKHGAEEFFQRLVDVPTGTVLWRKGMRASEMFIIEKGLLGIPGEELEQSLMKARTDNSNSQNSLNHPDFNASVSENTLQDVYQFNENLHRRKVVVNHPVWDATVVLYVGGFVEHLSRGQSVGEVEFLTYSVHPSSLLVVEKATLWKLSSSALQAMQSKNPGFLCILQQIALRCNSARLASPYDTTTLCNNPNI